MKNFKFVTGMVLGAVLATGGMLVAQQHHNLRMAQDLTEKAYNKVVEAQRINEFDMGGHAQRAKDLLYQASHEIKAAADAANE
jgi:hypothetical protein